VVKCVWVRIHFGAVFVIVAVITIIIIINKKIHYFRHFKKANSDKHYFYFAHFRKLVKVTIKTDRRQWLKSVDDSFKTQPQHFWKYVYNFKRKDNSFIQLKIDDQFATDPKHIADEFATYFQ
jgi:hypothetical protein